MVLIVSCVLTPWFIAFGDDTDSLEWVVTSYSIDTMFLIDIFVIFSSVFYDEDFNLIEDRKRIASEYIQSWLMIDILAILPFDLLISQEVS